MGERVWQLRAMGVPEILDETFRLYRRHFRKLFTIALAVRLPVAVCVSALSFLEIPNFDSPGLLLLMGIVGGLLYLAVHGLLVAALTGAISGGYLGRQISAKGAYRQALSHLPPLLGIFLATTPASILALVLGYGSVSIVMALLGGLLVTFSPFLGHYYYWGWPSTLIEFLFLVLGSFPYLWLNARLALAVPAVVLEPAPPRAALARSWRLTGGSRLRALGAYAALAFLSLFFIALPTFVLLIALIGFDAADGLVQAVMIIVPALLSALITPIRAGGLALLYYDLRIRREGLDLALQASALGREGARPLSALAPQDVPEG
jgi:hypothetical protein